MPDEVSCILQVVSDYLKDPCPITSLSGSQGPTHPESVKHPHGEDIETRVRREEHQVNSTQCLLVMFVMLAGWVLMQIQCKPYLKNCLQGSKTMHDSGTECCLSLCQAVSFLPAAEEDEETMMRKEDEHGGGTHTGTFILILLITILICHCHNKQLCHNIHLVV